MGNLQQVENKAIIFALGTFSFVWLVVGVAGMFMGLEELGFSLEFIFEYWALWTLILGVVSLVVTGLVKLTQKEW